MFERRMMAAVTLVTDSFKVLAAVVFSSCYDLRIAHQMAVQWSLYGQLQYAIDWREVNMLQGDSLFTPKLAEAFAYAVQENCESPHSPHPFLLPNEPLHLQVFFSWMDISH